MSASAVLSDVFHALGDPTRRALVGALTDGPQRMSDLAAPLPMSLTAVSKHLRVLEAAGLVRRERQGREHHFEVIPGGLDDAHGWISAQRDAWLDRFAALESVLATRAGEAATTAPAGGGDAQDRSR